MISTLATIVALAQSATAACDMLSAAVTLDAAGNEADALAGVDTDRAWWNARRNVQGAMAIAGLEPDCLATLAGASDAYLTR